MKANDTPSMTSNEIYARVKENEFINAPTHRVNVIDGNGVIRLSRPCWGLDMAESIAADREGEIDGWTVEIVEQKNRDEIQAYWDKGVTEYATELAESLNNWDKQPESVAELREMMLNGADDWKAYSYGGSALIYNQDIAERLCSPSELKRVTPDGKLYLRREKGRQKRNKQAKTI